MAPVLLLKLKSMQWRMDEKWGRGRKHHMGCVRRVFFKNKSCIVRKEDEWRKERQRETRGNYCTLRKILVVEWKWHGSIVLLMGIPFGRIWVSHIITWKNSLFPFISNIISCTNCYCMITPTQLRICAIGILHHATASHIVGGDLASVGPLLSPSILRTCHMSI